MAKTFDYKRTTATTMKLVGILHSDEGTIEVDGVNKDSLKTISDFDETEVTITIKTSSDEELDEPVE